MKSAIDILKEMKLAADTAKYPSIPDYAIVTRKYNDGNANGLTRCILDFIKLKGGYSVRVNTQGQMRGGKWTKGTTTPGTPDISAIVNGKAISVEIKVGRDTLSEAQIKQAELIQAAGGLYYVARDFEGFYKWFGENFKNG